MTGYGIELQIPVQIYERKRLSMIHNIHYDICAMLISLFSIIFVIFKKGIQKSKINCTLQNDLTTVK